MHITCFQWNRLTSVKSFFAFLFLLFSATTQLRAQAPNIILGRPTDTSITVSILFEQSMVYYIEYGLLSGTYPGKTANFNNAPGIPDEIDLHNLLPDSRYFYRVQWHTTGSSTFIASAEYSFHTQRAKGSSFVFTLEADEHLYDKKGVQNMYNITLNNEALDKPDFMMSLGDIFGDDHTPNTTDYNEMDSLHKAYRPFLGKICHSVPFYVCLGNHEGEKKYYLVNNAPNNIAVYGTLARKKYYPNPYPNGFYTGNTTPEGFGMGIPENYYAWNWGDALFVVLDVYRDDCDTSAKPTGWSWTLGLPEYTWLKNTLETSNAKYKFVFAHHIRGEGRGGILEAQLNEWGGYQKLGGLYTFPTYRPGWAKPIHQLFVDNHVNIFFQGHDHLFAHEILDSVTYQEVPMPSDSTYQIGMLANAGAYTADTIDGTGHIRVTVTPSCIKVDYIKAYLPADTVSGKHHNREIGFSYTIGKCATAGIRNASDPETMTVYPNPANRNLKMSFTNDETVLHAQLCNTIGQTLLESASEEMDCSQVTDGFYYLRVQTNTRLLTQKILIKH